MINRERLAALLGRERDTFSERPSASRAAYQAAGAHLLGNVPMTWMNKAAGRFPVYLAEALGRPLSTWTDTAMSTCAWATPRPWPGTRPGRRSRRAAALRRGRRATPLPTEDAAWVGVELACRFGVPCGASA